MNRFEPPSLPGGSHPAEPQNPYAAPGTGGPVDQTQAYSAQSYSAHYGAAPQAPWGPATAYQHPRGTTVLVLGILSIVLAPILGPFAWAMGRKALKEVDASQQQVSNRSTLQAGMVLGIIGTVFMVLGLVWLVVFIGMILAAIPATM